MVVLKVLFATLIAAFTPTMLLAIVWLATFGGFDYVLVVQSKITIAISFALSLFVILLSIQVLTEKDE